MPYVWDSDTEAANLARHGIDFTTAAQVFGDSAAITDYDAEDSRGGEDHWTTIGLVDGVLMVVRVIWTDHEDDNSIRVVSARLAGAQDRAIYQEWASL